MFKHYLQWYYYFSISCLWIETLHKEIEELMDLGPNKKIK